MFFFQNYLTSVKVWFSVALSLIHSFSEQELYSMAYLVIY